MTTSMIMRTTLWALLPGTAAMIWYFGIGVIFNLLIAVVTGLATEALMLRLRNKPLNQLGDGTVILTAALLGLCLPPLLPVYLVALGVAFAVIFGKHLYGGTGHNLFNPAMVGFAMLIVSFPLAMTQWPAPGQINGLEVMTTKLTMIEGRAAYDGITGATPLDAYKFRDGQTSDEFFDDEAMANWTPWIVVNFGFLLGGIFLLKMKIIRWQAPVAMLGMLTLLALVFYDSGSSASLGSPVFHLFSGATMLAAFFIITDPVTGPMDRRGLLVFGGLIGLMTFSVRTVGAYPEGVAFAVLLLNAAAPLIDHLLQARPVQRKKAVQRT